MKKFVNQRSTNVKKNQFLSEVKLRKIIQEELTREYLIQEGIWDDVSSGIKKLSTYVTKQFKSVATKWAAAITQKVSQLGEIPEGIIKIIDLLKQAMSETGESLKLDAGLQAAKELGQLNVETALSLIDEDFEGPVHNAAVNAEKNKTEAKQLTSLYLILSETKYTNSSLKKQRLNEDFGASTVLGVGLAVMGGLPMLFAGLEKLAHALHAEKAVVMFKKAEQVTHHFEQKVINSTIPDKIAYSVYLGLWKMGIKLTHTKEPFNEIEIKAEKQGLDALKKCKGLIYKTVLIYFAWNGLKGVLHAGASLMGFVEGSATAVKGVELAKGASEIAQLIRAGSGGLAV